MAIGGSKRLGYIDGSIKEPANEESKYSDQVAENMLIMNWILILMEEGIDNSFKDSTNAKEQWESIQVAYAQKRNNDMILGLKMEIAGSKQGTLSIGDYYSRFRALWIELVLHEP